MKLKTTTLLIGMLITPGLALATNVDEWVYKNVTGDLRPGAGCAEKEAAMEKVMPKPEGYKGYSRFEKHAKALCQAEGYGWTSDSVVDPGEVVCEECGGDYADRYRCQMINVTVKCKQVVR